MHSWKCAKNSTIKVKEWKHIKIMMAYFNNLILLILWMIMIGTSNTGECLRVTYSACNSWNANLNKQQSTSEQQPTMLGFFLEYHKILILWKKISSNCLS